MWWKDGDEAHLGQSPAGRHGVGIGGPHGERVFLLVKLCNCYMPVSVSSVGKVEVYSNPTLTYGLAKVPSLLVIPPSLRDPSLERYVRELGVSID